jgi:hypothetical protein
MERERDDDNRNLKKYDWDERTGLIWFRTGTSGGLLWS